MSGGEGSAPPPLEARGLSHTYDTGRRALADVSLALAAGERVGLVGPNGAGKSTLLLHLAGVLEAQVGQVLLGGRPASGAGAAGPDLEALRRQVGLVFQQADDMLFTTSVEDDVAFGPRQLGLSPEDVNRRVAAALKATQSEHLAERVPHHLSAGEKRHAAIAAVLSMEPGVLLLDEPTSDLDPRGRRDLLALLRGLDAALVVASHDLEFVLALCERVVVLDDGRVVADGAARALMGDEALMLAHGLERPHSLTPHPGGGHHHAPGERHGHPSDRLHPPGEDDHGSHRHGHGHDHDHGHDHG